MADTIDQKPKSEKEHVREFLTMARDKMQWCREQAAEYLKAHPRRKYYKITYDLCGEHVTHSCLSDEDLKRIQDMIKEIAEDDPSADDEERMAILCDNLDDLIDWHDYLPERHAQFIGVEDGEQTLVTGIDFDDFVYCGEFSGMGTEWFNEDKEKLHPCGYLVKLTDEEWIELVVYRLFDPRMTFHDLRELDRALYDRIVDEFYTPHECNFIIAMTEVNKVADAILKNNAEDERAKPLYNGPFHPFAPIWHGICNHPELIDDEQLIRAVKLALYTGEI